MVLPSSYTLYYHAFLPGRGEYIRLVLEAVGVKYEDIAKSPGGKESQQAVMAALASSPLPHMAPPFLEAHMPDGQTLRMSQTPLCCRFIAQQHGLMPDETQEALAAEALMLTSLDLANEAHNTHHPIATSKYFEEQKDEAISAARGFTAQRLPKYLAKIQAAIAAARKRTGNGQFAFGKLTVSDLALFQTMKGLEYAFPAAFAKAIKGMTAVQDVVKAVEEYPSIKAYLNSPRRLDFNTNGVFRYYPELQNDE